MMLKHHASTEGLLSGKQNNALHQLEISYLQLSDSTCTLHFPLNHHCLPLLFFVVVVELKCMTHSHGGAALLFCQRNSILQLHAVKW